MPGSSQNPLLNDRWASVVQGSLTGILKTSANSVVAAIGGPVGTGDYVPPSYTQTGSAGAPDSFVHWSIQPEYGDRPQAPFMSRILAEAFNGMMVSVLGIGYNTDGGDTTQPKAVTEFDGIIRENATDIRTQWQTAYETTIGLGVTLFKWTALSFVNDVADTVGNADAYIHCGFDPGNIITLQDPTGFQFITCSKSFGVVIGDNVTQSGTHGTTTSWNNTTDNSALFAGIDDTIAKIYTTTTKPLYLGVNVPTVGYYQLALQPGGQVTVGTSTLGSASATTETCAINSSNIFATYVYPGGPLATLIDSYGNITVSSLGGRNYTAYNTGGGPTFFIWKDTATNVIAAQMGVFGGTDGCWTLYDGLRTRARIYSDTASRTAINSLGLGSLNAQLESHAIDGTTPGLAIYDSGNNVNLQSGVAGTAIGGGALIQKQVYATGSLSFGAISAGAIATATITVTGAVASKPVKLGPPAAIEAGLIWCAAVTAANTVTISVHNTTASPITPATATWSAEVTNY